MKARLQTLWFWSGGALGSAMGRIAIATSVLLSLHKLGISDYVADRASRSAALYDPDGILMLLGSSMPAPALLDAMRWVAWISTIAFLLGLFTRITHAISLVSALILVSFQFSFASGWAHQYNVVFLAQIAFLGARSGDVLSLDALILRSRSKPRPAPDEGYQWALRLVAFAIAFMYFDAFLHKLVAGGGTLGWAFSDNLRNQLLVRFDWIGLDRTAVGDWLLQAPWRYQTAAVLNLIAQLSPILAVVWFRRPVVRAALGLFFVIETVALALVMDLWNLHWLPLYVFFIDWDWLLGRRAPSAPSPSSPPRWCRWWIAVYVGITIVIGVVPKLDYTLKTYPFSRFPMFGTVRAKKPYGEPQTYSFLGNRIELLGKDAPIKLQAWLDRSYAYRWLQRDAGTGRLVRKIEALEAALERRRAADGFTGVRDHLVLFQAPPRPHPAELVLHRVGILADKPRGEPVRMVKGRFEDGGVTANFVGWAKPPEIAGWWQIVDDEPAPIPLRGTGPHIRIEAPGAESTLFLVDVRDGDETLRFVVARRPAIGW